MSFNMWQSLEGRNKGLKELEQIGIQEAAKAKPKTDMSKFQAGASLVGQSAQALGGGSTAGGALGGAASGAASGAAFGPKGALIGGAIGGITGALGARNKRKALQQQVRSQAAAQRAQREADIEMNKTAQINNALQSLSNAFSRAYDGSSQIPSGFRSRQVKI